MVELFGAGPIYLAIEKAEPVESAAVPLTPPLLQTSVPIYSTCGSPTLGKVAGVGAPIRMAQACSAMTRSHPRQR